MKIGDLVRHRKEGYDIAHLPVNDCYGIVSHVSLDADRKWAFVSFMQKDGSITKHMVYSEYLNVISEIIS